MCTHRVTHAPRVTLRHVHTGRRVCWGAQVLRHTHTPTGTHTNAETRTHSHPDTQTDTETLEHAKTRRRAVTAETPRTPTWVRAANSRESRAGRRVCLLEPPAGPYLGRVEQVEQRPLPDAQHPGSAPGAWCSRVNPDFAFCEAVWGGTWPGSQSLQGEVPAPPLPGWVTSGELLDLSVSQD